ncbi:MAG: hypothetical protein JWR75_1031 [Devosia sp.]|nr:hypothetical protein [Devosia sp.]
MRISGWDYSREQLLRRVGNIAQIGGVSLAESAEGHSRGVRTLEVRTGTGFQFGVLPDRGLDIGRAEFQGLSLAWLAPKLFPAPWYYEGGHGDPYSFVRTALGGLFNTCGLVHIGNQKELPTDHYGYGTRMTEVYGIHDRISMTPADRFNYGEDWDGDHRRLWVSGTVRQELAYGENLLLERRYETELGSNSVTISDVVRNEGYYPSPHQMLYHFNIGFPILDASSELLCTPAEDAEDLAASLSNFAKGEASRDKFRDFVAPQQRFGVEAYGVKMKPDSDGMVAVAVVNRNLRPERGGVGVFLRYNAKQLPHYIAWRQMAEGLYAVGLEPATNPFSTPEELKQQGYPVMLEPGEERRYELEFGVLDGKDAIDEFAAALPAH